MFKPRPKARDRGGDGRYNSSTKVPLKGLFTDGIWQCNCNPRFPAQHFQTKNGGKNHGRWFYTCQKAQPKRCDFFLWDDEAKKREAAAVLNNSRTEPGGLVEEKEVVVTPRKEMQYGLATPQTGKRGRGMSPEVQTPCTPSKSGGVSARVVGAASGTQATAIRSTESDGEFYDWPTSDDDELSKAADQASSEPSMAPPETPRKAVKMSMHSTPGKRGYHEMAAENGDIGITTWPTPSTGTKDDVVFVMPATGVPGRGLFANLHASPAETPTPIRYKDVPPGQESDLTREVLNALQAHNISLPADGRDALKTICDKHLLNTRGIMKGRDVSRALVKSKDERIAEMQGEIEGLKAERETNRTVIRHLRRDMASRSEGRK